MSKMLKVMGGSFAALILLGSLVDKCTPNPTEAARQNGQGYPAPHMPAAGNGNDPRFHGPGHPMYGKNYYQAGNEILNEMRQAGYSEEHIKMVIVAMEATKCRSCNGYGWRGQYRCEVCKGDGVLEN